MAKQLKFEVGQWVRINGGDQPIEEGSVVQWIEYDDGRLEIHVKIVDVQYPWRYDFDPESGLWISHWDGSQYDIRAL